MISEEEVGEGVGEEQEKELADLSELIYSSGRIFVTKTCTIIMSIMIFLVVIKRLGLVTMVMVVCYCDADFM